MVANGTDPIEQERCKQKVIEAQHKSDVGGADVERDRVLSKEEILLLAERVPAKGQHNIAGLARLELPTQVAIWLALSTMSRIGLLSMMRWQNIDFDKQTG
ncbi:hypothetical protein KSF73_00320 [Burkholderiaceae bacterium DAT-1]|nr:hypothetical protein [Burkholderiaceae bacterium DAT-1]